MSKGSPCHECPCVILSVSGFTRKSICRFMVENDESNSSRTASWWQSRVPHLPAHMYIVSRICGKSFKHLYGSSVPKYSSQLCPNGFNIATCSFSVTIIWHSFDTRRLWTAGDMRTITRVHSYSVYIKWFTVDWKRRCIWCLIIFSLCKRSQGGLNVNRHGHFSL